MSKTTGKRAFVASQPAAAISALDFASASEAFRRAMEAPATASLSSESLDQCADRLIAIPTTNPAQIAEKVSALAYLTRASAVPLSDTEAHHRIIENGTDAQQRLLAIYLDLTTEPETTWESVMARVRAVRARIDAWEAEAPENEDDDRLFPSDLRDEREAAEQAMLEEVPPHWLAVREKALLLRPFACEDVEEDYVIRTDVGGVEGHLGRLLEATAEIGDCDPADAPDLLVLKACLYAEGVARAALTDKRSGYPGYAVNPRAISEMSAIIGALQEDARLLSHSVAHCRASVIAIDEVWFPKDGGEVGPVAA